MRVKEGAKMLAGSIVIYVVMAACSANTVPGGFLAAPNDDGGQAQDDGSSGGGAQGDGSSGGATGDGPSILDAIMNPVAEASADTNQSGTRLKAQYYAGSDGSRQSAGMYDSQLKTTCSFMTASDGTVRCIPSGTGTIYASSGVFFSDSSCSQLLASAPPGCTVQYAYKSGGSCASTQYQVFTTSVFSGVVYYGTGPTNCVVESSSASASTAYAGYTFYTLGAEMPPSQFVQATLQTD